MQALILLLCTGGLNCISQAAAQAHCPLQAVTRALLQFLVSGQRWWNGKDQDTGTQGKDVCAGGLEVLAAVAVKQAELPVFVAAAHSVPPSAPCASGTLWIEIPTSKGEWHL